MSLARKYDYSMPTAGQLDLEAEKKLLKEKREVRVKQTIMDALPQIAIIFLVTIFSITYIARFDELNRLQVEIFNIKQLNEEYNKKIYNLKVNQDSGLSIEMIEEYAINDLGMIAATEKNKVVIKTNDYYILDSTIAFKSSENSFASLDEKAKESELVVANNKSRR